MTPEVKSFIFLGTGIILGAFAFWGCRTTWIRRVIRVRMQRGIKAETHASALLNLYGYELVEEQSPISMEMEVDGEKFDYEIRPDGMAVRDGESFLVEIKTGAKAGDLSNPITRRQLFEYYFSLPCSGILFVKPEEGSVQTVRFCSPLVRDDERQELEQELEETLLEHPTSPFWGKLLTFVGGAVAGAIILLFAYTG